MKSKIIKQLILGFTFLTLSQGNAFAQFSKPKNSFANPMAKTCSITVGLTINQNLDVFIDSDSFINKVMGDDYKAHLFNSLRDELKNIRFLPVRYNDHSLGSYFGSLTFLKGPECPLGRVILNSNLNYKNKKFHNVSKIVISKCTEKINLNEIYSNLRIKLSYLHNL